MSVCITHPLMFNRKRVKLPRKVVQDLKHISDLSCKKKWEYAGNVDCKVVKNVAVFSKPSFVTSRDRDQVKLKTVELVWPALVSYHTHPCAITPNKVDYDKDSVFVTLPSNQDFEAFITCFPNMQTNIICDAHGYYVIDILDAVERNNLPLPAGVNRIMNDFRQEPKLREMVFSEDGLEYFDSTLNTWKRLINVELNQKMRKILGITIRFYGYEDEPPLITFDLDSI